PGRAPALPEALKQSLVTKRVHALPEAVVTEGRELPISRQTLQPVCLETGVIAFQVVEQARFEDHVAAVDPSLADLRLFGKLRHQIPVKYEPAEPCRGSNGGNRCNATVCSMKIEQGRQVNVADPVPIRHHERTI